MRYDLRKKAILITVLLSVVLLGLGIELGWLLGSRQVDEANLLTTQATEKVLILTQEKQALEQQLQRLQHGGQEMMSGEVWSHEGSIYGMVRVGGWVMFNDELKVELLGLSPTLAQVGLAWPGNQLVADLSPGERLQIAANLQIRLLTVGPGWVIVALEQI